MRWFKKDKETETVNLDTGEIGGELIPVQATAVVSREPIEVEQVGEMVAYVEKMKVDIMKHGRDYMVIPGTKKPSLLKPGAEKLCFAFHLSPNYTILDSNLDYLKDWEYEGSEWIDRQKVPKMIKTRGFFAYTVDCQLVHRQTGAIWATASGACDSGERGREVSPANTILKMAQKRALMAATTNATFSSDLFTQDIEDYKGNQSVAGDNKASQEGAYPASEKQLKYVERLLKQASDMGADTKIITDCDLWMQGKQRNGKQASNWIEILMPLTKAKEEKKSPTEPRDYSPASDSHLDKITKLLNELPDTEKNAGYKKRCDTWLAGEGVNSHTAKVWIEALEKLEKR